MKLIITIALVLVICQLVHSSTQVSIEKGLGGVTGSTQEVSPHIKSTLTSMPTILKSNIHSTRSSQACSCTGCATDTDVNLKFYWFNTTCLDSRNFAGNTFYLGSDNTSEMYRFYFFTESEFRKWNAGNSAQTLSQLTTNCLSNENIAYNSPNLISAYRCESAVVNATTCTTKYKYTGACFIGLNAINATSMFEDGKLKVYVDLYGTDGKLWTRAASNVKVTVKSASYSGNVSTLNIYKGSTLFTFPVSNTNEAFTITVEAENYFGTLTQSLVQNRLVSAGSTLSWGQVLMMIAFFIFTLF